MITISGSFDDGSIYDLKVVEYLNDRGIETVFFIPVNWKKYNASKGVGFLDEEDIENIATLYEIGSHGIDHLLLTRVDEQVQTREIIDSRKYWRQNHFRINAFCYPRGYYTTEIKQKVKDAGYKWARTVKIGELQPSVDPFETHTTVHVGYDRKEYGTDWLTYARAKIKEAIRRSMSGENIEYRFWGHSEEIERLGQWDRFKEFLDDLEDMR